MVILGTINNLYSINQNTCIRIMYFSFNSNNQYFIKINYYWLQVIVNLLTTI